MLSYVRDALKHFNHTAPQKPQDQPFPHVKPNYGAKAQYSSEDDTSTPLSKDKKRFVQEVVGTFLYYTRAVDATMLPALGSIASQQAAPTEQTMKRLQQLLHYAATHPDAITTYCASAMVITGHSDASYFSEAKSLSRAGGHFFMTDESVEPPNNGAVTIISIIIKTVISSAAEAELCALFINRRESVPARITLGEMGNKHTLTPMQTDNTTALGVVNNNIVSKKLKSMDMIINWLQCREYQNQLPHYWKQGPKNLGDYATKHQSAIHHRTVSTTYLTSNKDLDLLLKRHQSFAATTAGTPELFWLHLADQSVAMVC